MRVVVQRVREAEVTVEDASVGSIGAGLVALVGIARGDGEREAAWMARKVAELRVFEDEGGRLQQSVCEVGGAVLAVSQFTLLADCRKGRRPSFDLAMTAAEAAPCFERFVAALRACGLTVATGRFGAHMLVRLVNDGPLTVIIDSPTRA